VKGEIFIGFWGMGEKKKKSKSTKEFITTASSCSRKMKEWKQKLR
jgi:hypothetical protein